MHHYARIMAALLVCLLCGSEIVWAQKTEKAPLSPMDKVMKLNWKKKFAVGKILYDQGSYYNAIDVLSLSFNEKQDKKNVCSAYLLAASYYQTRDYANAETYFRKVLELDSAAHPYTQYYLGQSLKRQAKYEEAKVAFSAFKQTQPNKISDDFTVLQRSADSEIAGCDLGLKMQNEPVKADVEHLNRGLNHPLSDYSPISLGNGQLLYAALGSDTLIDITDSTIDDKLRYTRLYVSSESNGSWANGQLFDFPFNKGDYHIGNGTYSPDKNRFYFTRCLETEVITKMHCEIWVSTKSGSTWGEPVLVGNGISAEGHTATHPYSVLDETGKEVLFFSSDRSGGNGGMDIWYTYPDANGGFSNPENAGNYVNTYEDEVTPSYDTKKKVLYFSSLGHVNIGGFDIYASEKDRDGKYTLPKNVGYPVNSSVDDLYYRPTTSTRGFLVSNRVGGYNMKSPTCCDDVLSFIFPPTNVFVEGDVTESTNGGIPVTNGIVYIYRKDNDSLVASTPVDAQGKYKVKLEGGYDYVVVAGGDNYYEQRKEVSTLDLEDNAVIRQDFVLDKKAYFPGLAIGKVYYDYNKAKLRDDARVTLDSVVNFLTIYPKVTLEVGGHTDWIGSNEYNDTLSLQRAEAVMNYLIRTGKISEKRLVKKGYGENRPAVPNTNPDGTDNPDNRQLNRRTEFIIIGETLD